MPNDTRQYQSGWTGFGFRFKNNYTAILISVHCLGFVIYVTLLEHTSDTFSVTDGTFLAFYVV